MVSFVIFMLTFFVEIRIILYIMVSITIIWSIAYVI